MDLTDKLPLIFLPFSGVLVRFFGHCLVVFASGLVSRAGFLYYSLRCSFAIFECFAFIQLADKISTLFKPQPFFIATVVDEPNRT